MDHQEAVGPRDTGATDAAGHCPFRIDRPVMRQRWARLTFLHWSFEPEAVQRLLPDGLVADLFDGVAWVGLVPFYMNVSTAGRQVFPTVATAGRHVSPTVGTGGGFQVPWVSRFCETNVRTYVRDEQGRAGIWFFSLDAARLGAVVVARTTYRLPYFWSAMRISEHGRPASDGQDSEHGRPASDGQDSEHGRPASDGQDSELPDEIAYRCRRRLPGPRDATSVVRVRVEDRYQASELSARDHFLTARWILFSSPGSGNTRHLLARACHDPWPLYRAQALVVRDRLITAAGLPEPQGTPLVHYSPGVDVTIGRPERGH
jgi:uncharacterized protein YqjF (DUF2071 family)